MNVAISTNGLDLSGEVAERFGRCGGFLIVDSETMAFEVIPNEAIGMAHGAGIAAASLVVSKGVESVLTGNVGPNAFRALSASNVQVFSSVSGPIRDALQRLLRGELKPTTRPDVSGHFGRGGGRGRMGGGRGRQD